MTEKSISKKPILEKNVTVKFSKKDYDRLVAYCKKNKYKMSYLIREIVLCWYNH